MKTILFVLLLVPALGLAQVANLVPSRKAYQSTALLSAAGAASHVNSTIDTSGVFYPGAFNQVSLLCVFNDSTAVVPIVEKRAAGESSWNVVTAAAGDTIYVANSSNNAQRTYEVILRNAATDRVGGVSTEMRLRSKAVSSGNGTSAGFTAYQWYLITSTR